MTDWTEMQSQSSANGDMFSMFLTKNRSPLTEVNGTLSELHFSPSPAKMASHLSDPYRTEENGNLCGSDNFNDCVTHLNRELTLLGLPSLYSGTSNVFDKYRLINCTYELLQRQRLHLQSREDLENRLHRNEADLQSLQTTQCRLKDELEQCNREAAQRQEKERQLLSKNKLLSTKLKAEKDEVTRLLSVIQHRNAQFKHEVRKKEREMLKLKDRLHHLLSMKTGTKFGMEISNTLQRPDGKRGTWKTGQKHEEEMYRQVISTYEEKQKELMVENTELRQSLKKLQKDVVELLHSPSPETVNGTSHETPPAGEGEPSDSDGNAAPPSTDLSDGHFQMPYEIVQDNILGNLEEKFDLLKRRVKHLEKKNKNRGSDRKTSPTKALVDGKHREEMDKVNKQLQRYRSIIEQQEELLQHTLQPPQLDDQQSFLHDADLLEERECLAGERRLFGHQKDNLDTERRTLTDAAIRLGRERKNFEDEKSAHMQKQFLEMTPFQNKVSQSHSWMSVHTGKTRRILPAAPNFSPAPQSSQSEDVDPRTPKFWDRPRTSTPSTAELYKRLGLPSPAHQPTLSRPRSAGVTDPARCHSMESSYLVAGDVTPTVIRHGVHKQNEQGDNAGELNGRVSEHVDQVRMALFNRHGQEEGNGQGQGHSSHEEDDQS